MPSPVSLLRPAAMLAAVALAVALVVAPVAADSLCDTIPYYTEAEQTSTYDFLAAFTEAIPALKEKWTCRNFCSYDGVTCDPLTGVAVSLAAEGLTGTLPDVPSSINASAVQVYLLDVSGNSGITGTLPSSWGGLTKLTSVSVRVTSVSGTLPAMWSALSLLRFFYADYSLVTGPLPDAWWALPKLEMLYANNAQLNGTLPDSWGAMLSISDLRLSANNLTGTLPSVWAVLTADKLELANNNFYGSIPSSWAQMPNIKTVSLNGNGLCGCLPYYWQILGDALSVSVDANNENPGCETTLACSTGTNTGSSVSSNSASSTVWSALQDEPGLLSAFTCTVGGVSWAQYNRCRQSDDIYCFGDYVESINGTTYDDGYAPCTLSQCVGWRCSSTDYLIVQGYSPSNVTTPLEYNHLTWWVGDEVATPCFCSGRNASGAPTGISVSNDHVMTVEGGFKWKYDDETCVSNGFVCPDSGTNYLSVVDGSCACCPYREYPYRSSEGLCFAPSTSSSSGSAHISGGQSSSDLWWAIANVEKRYMAFYCLAGETEGLYRWTQYNRCLSKKDYQYCLGDHVMDANGTVLDPSVGYDPCETSACPGWGCDQSNMTLVQGYVPFNVTEPNTYNQLAAWAGETAEPPCYCSPKGTSGKPTGVNAGESHIITVLGGLNWKDDAYNCVIAGYHCSSPETEYMSFQNDACYCCSGRERPYASALNTITCSAAMLKD